MGYEGHVMLVEDPAEKRRQVEQCMSLLLAAAADVGGDVVSAGGTGTYRENHWCTEVQAGSYALMDTAYSAAGLPFAQALTVLARVISTSPKGWAVADLGLKSLGHGPRQPDGPGRGRLVLLRRAHDVQRRSTCSVGDLVRALPAHVDPTVALHERMHLVDGDQVLETWPVDLRGW